jgi:hypothetical protein
MGETDVVEQVLVERLKGHLHFGRMHMKPGKLTTFVTIPSPRKERGSSLPCRATQSVLLFAHTGSTRLIFYFTALIALSTRDGDSVEECIRQTVLDAWVHPEVQAGWHTIFSWTRNDQNTTSRGRCKWQRMAYVSGVDGCTAVVPAGESA